MPRYQQVSQFVGVGLPFLGLPLAIWLLWGHGVSPTDLAIMATLYVLTGLGIGVGYHRLLTHRAFETMKPANVMGMPNKNTSQNRGYICVSLESESERVMEKSDTTTSAARMTIMPG